MKKNVFKLATAILICCVFSACKADEHPFSAVSENMMNYVQSIQNESGLKNDEDYFKDFFKKQKSLCAELEGKTIPVEIEKGLGFELLSDKANIGIGLGEAIVSIPIIFDLKVVDANIASKNLMSLLYNDDNEVVYANSLEDFNPDIDIENLFKEELVVEEVDSGPRSLYEVGDILHQKTEINIHPACAQQFVNASKLVIVEYDSDVIHAIQKKNEEAVEVLKKMFDVQEDNELVLGNGKLGLLQIGQSISGLPKSVSGLYDKYFYKKEVHEDDMDGPWTEEYVLFTKKGSEILRTDVSNNQIVSIRLLEGSTFIKTEDGFYVGYSARELFKKKRMEWSTYYMGEVFATSGRYTYYISSEDLIQADIPERVDQIKPDAKVISIEYK